MVGMLRMYGMLRMFGVFRMRRWFGRLSRLGKHWSRQQRDENRYGQFPHSVTPNMFATVQVRPGGAIV
jgi:hypothetical protein